MGENGEEPLADSAQFDKRLPEPDERKEVDFSERGGKDVKEPKKTSDAILDELFSSIRNSGAIVDVAEAITEVSRTRKEREARDKSRSRSRSRDRKHKHKKNKKEKKMKKHRSRSRSHDRKRRRRSHSSSPGRIGKTGTLADIRINTKTKNLDDLKNTVPVTSTYTQEDDDDDLPVGADYRTVMAEAVINSEPSTSQGPSLADVPTAVKMQPAFPLKKSDGEKKDGNEDNSNSMLKKVISEKGGAQLVPRKIQIESSKNNGSAADSFGPAPPPVENDVKDEDVEMTTPITIKLTPKIAFGHISLKVNGGGEKKEGGNGVTKKDQDEKMDVDQIVKEDKKNDNKKDETNEDKEKKAVKKMAVRRRRSSSVEKKKDKERKEEKDRKERRRSRSRSKDRRDRDRSRDRRDSRRDGGRSNERNRRDDRRRRSRSRSAERRRDDRERDRSRRSRSRERRRSRERSKSREKIDKKKLLEIALQNARGVSGPVAEKQGVNMKILEKAGGKNIGDIVSYCQKLSETENAEKVGGRDSDDDDLTYKSKKEIKLNIPGSKQLPISTPQERLVDTAPLRAAFPVSSGVIHRENAKDTSNEWRKVDPTSSVPSVCTSVQKKLVASSSLTKMKAESEGRSVTIAAYPILPPPPVPPTIRGDLIPPPPPPPIFNTSSLVPPPPMPPTIITPSSDRLISMPDSGYDEDNRSVSRRMEERSKVVNRLLKDPNDTEAMKILSQIDDALNNFGKSAELSGRWMGHTRVNLLSGDELQPHDPRFHAWVKKDLFKSSVPIVSGVGMKLMQKMGWNPGEGLGRENQGDTQPLTLDVKSDRKGLYSEGYDMPIPKGKSKGGTKKGGGTAASGGSTGGGQPEAKNSISALMELAQGKKWEMPVFDFQSTGGINKTFTCTVKVNGFEFLGPVCPNKKAAKTECARVALEKIGYAAPNVQTPVIFDPSSQFSMPEQIVQARLRSAFEAAEMSAIPPPPSYVAPLSMSAAPPEKYDPAQIQAMQEQRDKEAKETKAPQPVPPPILSKEKEEEKKSIPPPPPTQPHQPQSGRGRGRGRGRGGRGGTMDRGMYYAEGPYPPPPHMMRGGPPQGHYPPFPPPHMDYGGYEHMGGQWGPEPEWNDYSQDVFDTPSYSSFPSGPFSSRPSANWTPDDEFHPHSHPPQYGRPPHQGPRQHSPAYEQPRYL